MQKTKIDIFGEHFPFKMMAEFRFWKKVTPVIFEILGWILMIGAIQALSKATGNFWLKVLYMVSYFTLFFYLHEHVNSVELNLSFVKSQKAVRNISIIVMGLLGLGLWFFISHVLDLLPLAPPS